MNIENLRKFLSEISDIVYSERKTVLAVVLITSFFQLLIFFLDRPSSNSYPIIIENQTISTSDNTSIESKNIQLFPFNPSTIDYDGLLRLGFSEKTARIYLNYRNKGGKFYSKEDVKKIYSLSDELYHKIEPYIRIESKPESTTYSYSSTPKVYSIDINKATLKDWEQLPGIGNYFATKFIIMRDGLGAFHSIQQIKEFYRFPDSTFRKIEPYLTISQGEIRKINLNKASAEDLKNYPYILPWQADDILKHRPIFGLEDLYELRTFKNKNQFKLKEIYFEF